jgi:hypothetical protein
MEPGYYWATDTDDHERVIIRVVSNGTVWYGGEKWVQSEFYAFDGPIADPRAERTGEEGSK